MTDLGDLPTEEFMIRLSCVVTEFARLAMQVLPELVRFNI